MTQTEALKLALEALELTARDYREQRHAITAIREALAQPEQEPVAWSYWQSCLNDDGTQTAPWVHRLSKFQPSESIINKDITPLYTTPPQQPVSNPDELAQPEQEPVVWMYQDKSTHEVQFQKHMRSFVDHSKTSEVPLYSEPLANHELQCVCGAVWCGDEMVHLPNKIPPQRKPLSNQKIIEMYNEPRSDAEMIEFARAIESAHGIKE